MSFAELWQLLTKDATGLSVLVAAAALLASVLSALVSAWAAREARVMRQAQTEGDVIAYLEQSSQVFQAADLVIRNVGAGVAYEVTVETAGGWMIDASPEAPPRYLANVGFVRHGLPLLAPGQTVRTFIGVATEVMSRPVRHFEVTVTFRPTEGAAPRSPDLRHRLPVARRHRAGRRASAGGYRRRPHDALASREERRQCGVPPRGRAHVWRSQTGARGRFAPSR